VYVVVSFISKESPASKTAPAAVRNEKMTEAAQLHVIESGEDPRECTLLAFGGAAPLHAFDIAKALGIRHVILPRQAGVLSAFGFLTAQVGFEQVQSHLVSVPELDTNDLLSTIDDLREKAITTLGSGPTFFFRVEKAS